MNLRQTGPLCEAVAPELYDGTESVVANLCTQSSSAALRQPRGRAYPDVYERLLDAQRLPAYRGRRSVRCQFDG